MSGKGTDNSNACDVADYCAPALYIDGEWLNGSAESSTHIVNPASGERLAVLSHVSVNELQRTVESAERGFELWRRVPPIERGRIIVAAAQAMRNRSEAMARLLTLEQGKPLAQARTEIQVAADMVQWYGEQARRIYGRIVPSPQPGARYEVLHEPVGPCALFSPWNMPVLLAARKVAGALAAGCSAILKPAEETPAAAAEMVRCFIDAGVPKGVLSLVFGVPGRISTALLEASSIRKMSFTGSVTVGRELARLAMGDFKRVTLELGGYASVIVLDDADLDAAVRLTVSAKFRNAGQLCLAPTRWLVHERVYEQFVAAFVQCTNEIIVGNGLDPKVTMGPLATSRRRTAVAAAVDDARSQGSKILTGGRALEGAGYFYAPTVLTNVPSGARIRTEEPFGPIAMIDSFVDLSAAIRAANAVPYGLAGYAFTNSASAQRQIAEGLDVGSLAINNVTVSGAEAPFGGVKHSGFGRESGEEGLMEYLTVKTVHVR